MLLGYDSPYNKLTEIRQEIINTSRILKTNEPSLPFSSIIGSKVSPGVVSNFDCESDFVTGLYHLQPLSTNIPTSVLFSLKKAASSSSTILQSPPKTTGIFKNILCKWLEKSLTNLGLFVSLYFCSFFKESILVSPFEKYKIKTIFCPIESLIFS